MLRPIIPREWLGRSRWLKTRTAPPGPSWRRPCGRPAASCALSANTSSVTRETKTRNLGMFDRVRTVLLRLLRVPPAPEPPFGNPASVRIFRASRKLYLLRLVRWSFVQLAALAGILFWLAVVGVSEHESNRMRAQRPEAGALSRLPAG